MGQIKRLYRLLARRLHPDTGSEQSRESQALWLEAQNAYECRDLPRLEALWATLNEHDPDSFTSMISIADIQETVKQILKAVGGLKKEIRKAHKDPAWGFSLPAARKGKKVHKKIKVEIEGELSEAQDALQSLESLIDGWISEPVHGSARGAGRAGTFEEESAYGSQRSRGRSRSR
ncbi:MAG: hypothetical protein H7222_03470 [Methylotenera sp.]|nr:hypothetical protein [Oligoflexia bacterium]